MLHRYGSVRSYEYMRYVVCSSTRSAAALCPVLHVLCASLVNYIAPVFVWLFQSFFVTCCVECPDDKKSQQKTQAEKIEPQRELSSRRILPPLGSRPRDIHSSTID